MLCQLQHMSMLIQTSTVQATYRIALSYTVHVMILSQAVVWSDMWQAVAYGMNKSILHTKPGIADNSSTVHA